MSSRVTDFDRFWPFYLGEHLQPGTRVLHAIGSAFGLVCHLVLVPLTFNLTWIFAGFASGYACAWISHGLIERNRPATLRYPFWSFFADLEMLVLLVLGRLDDEHTRYQVDPFGPSSRRRLCRWILRFVVIGYDVLMALGWWAGYLEFRRLF